MNRVVILLFALIVVFTSCTTVTLPESGVFFCEELGMTLDFKAFEGAYTVDGVDYLLKFSIERNGEITVNHYAENTLVFEGELRYDGGSCITIEAKDGNEYNFEKQN